MTNTRASELQELQSYTELQSFEQRYENAQNTVKHRTFRDLVMGNRFKDENAAAENHSRDRDQESRDASLAKIIAEAVAQQTQVHRRGSFKTKVRRNTGTHRCISKADGGDTGAVSRTFKGKLHTKTLFYP